MMKRLGLWLVLLVFGAAALWCPGCSSNGGSSSNSGVTATFVGSGKNALTSTIRSRKLKGNTFPFSKSKDVNLEDYNSNINPVPSSTASIRPGPIQHGAPQIPYIPAPVHPPPPPLSPFDQAMHVGGPA